MGPLIGVSAGNVHRMDDRLHPFFIGKNRQRWFRKSVVLHYVETHKFDDHTLTLSETAKMLRMHADRVKALDGVLRPIVINRGACEDRLYHPQRVLEYMTR